MDLQSRKIAFVQEFLKIQNEDIIDKLEKLLKQEEKAVKRMVPMSEEEFNKRIDTSMEDSKHNRLIESNELQSKIEKWV